MDRQTFIKNSDSTTSHNSYLLGALILSSVFIVTWFNSILSIIEPVQPTCFKAKKKGSSQKPVLIPW